ncbi:hypothetical protein TorRG33x02_340480, partial [Trema orientale]
MDKQRSHSSYMELSTLDPWDRAGGQKDI